MGVDVLQEREVPLNVDDLKGCITSILDEYMDQANWYLVTSIDTEESSPEQSVQHSGLAVRAGGVSSSVLLLSPEPPVTTRTMNSNIWQICIQLEGVGCFAAVLGKEFRLLLLSALYPVLEKAGDRTLLISETALGTLADICEACGYNSVQCLINENSDYLVNGISLNLRQLAHQPRASQVLDTMLRHSDASLLPLVEDVIQDVLSALDQSYNSQASTFLRVLHSVMTALGTKTMFTLCNSALLSLRVVVLDLSTCHGRFQVAKVLQWDGHCALLAGAALEQRSPVAFPLQFVWPAAFHRNMAFSG